MALTPSGQISMSDINSALGRSSTASINFNDANVRFLANQESGSVTMAAMRSKYYFTGTITVGRLFAEEGTYYGYNSGAFGSITGNIGAAIQLMQSLGNSTYLDPVSNATPFASTGRLKVSSQSTLAMTYRPSDSKTPAGYYNTSTALFTAGNYTGTYTWQFGNY